MIHRYSLFTYLLLIILLSSSIVLGIVIFGNQNLTGTILRDHEVEKFKLMTQAASDEIEIRLTNIEEVIRRNSSLFRDQNPHSREEAIKILEQSMSNFPSIFAMEIIFTETEAEQIEEAGYTALYAYRHSSELLTPDKKESEGEAKDPGSFEIVDRTDLDADYSSEWYNKPIILGEPIWTSPYYDPQINVLMITYSVPVYDRPDHIEAVLTADVSLEWLDQLIDTFDIGKTGEPVLITPDQIIFRSETESEREPDLVNISDAIADFESAAQTKNQKKEKYSNLFDLLKGGKSGEIRFTNPYDGEKRQGGRLRVRQGQGLHLLHGSRQVRLQEARLQVRQVKGADA